MYNFQDDAELQASPAISRYTSSSSSSSSSSMSYCSDENRGPLLNATYKVINYPLCRVGESCYEASSPDELALVCGAKDLGVEFVTRTPNTCEIAFTDALMFEAFGNQQFYKSYLETAEREQISTLGEHFCRVDELVDRKKDIPLPSIEFPILDVLEFDNERKKMSVIIRDELGFIRVLTKGADNAMMDSEKQIAPKRDLNKTFHLLSTSGLRTLVYGQKIISEVTWKYYEEKLLEARTVEESKQDEAWQCICAEIEEDIE